MFAGFFYRKKSLFIDTYGNFRVSVVYYIKIRKEHSWSGGNFAQLVYILVNIKGRLKAAGHYFK